MRRLIAYATAAAVTVAGGVVLVGGGGQANAASARSEVQLEDAWGRPVAEITFSRHAHDGSTLVEAIFFSRKSVKKGTFHGLHVHANDDASNGRGCKADPGESAATWFVSADGHWVRGDQEHGDHRGDLPSPYIQRNGSAHLVFTTDRFSPGEVVGKAVVLHAGPDNFGNVPVGDDDDEYRPGSDEATAKTAKTGNAGDRVACGVVKRR
jgi:superoxide dismutase, Cu-Zn family